MNDIAENPSPSLSQGVADWPNGHLPVDYGELQSVDSASNDEPVGVTTRVRHEKYYFSMLTFLVEDCLFKLPRHYFEQSEAFQGMFTIPPSDQREGTSDDKPIHLEGTKLEDFEAFVTALVPMVEGGSKEALSLQEWLAALELAYKWGFQNTHRVALDAIAELPMSEVDEINLIQKYGIMEWACPAYEKLVVREGSLTANEMKLLGLEFSSKMAEARERYVKVSNNRGYSDWHCESCRIYNDPFQNCPNCNAPDPSSVANAREVIHAVFGDPVVIL